VQTWVRILCLIFLLSYFLDASWAFGKETSDAARLTSQEKAWISAHPNIRLAPDPEFRPIEYFDDKGNYVGMAADYARLIGQKLGIRFTIVRCATWDEVIARAKRREVDVLNAVVKTKQREAFLLFPAPYLKIPSVIIVRKSVDRHLTLDMLKGMNIVMVSGYGYVDVLRNQYPQLKIELVPDLKTSLRKVSFGLADAFVGDLATASYYIESEGITNLRVAGETKPPNISGFAVRSDWPELSLILGKGIAQLTEEEHKSIYRRWIHLESEPTLPVREFRKVMLIVAGIIALVVFGFIFWTRTLRRMVHLRTEDLRKELHERQRVEEELSKSEKKYRELYDFLPIPVYEMDFEGNLSSVNRAVYETFRGTEEDLKRNSSAWQLLSQDEIDKSARNILRLLSGEQIGGTEYTFKRLDGSVFPAIVISSVIYSEGKPVGLRGAIVDITDRKRAEEALKESENKYRLLADNVNDVIFVLDMNLNYTYISPSVKFLRGYEPEEALRQRSSETMTPPSWELAMTTLSEVLALEEEGHGEKPLSRTLRLEVRRKDGSTVWTEMKFSFIRDDSLRPVGILGVTRDITDRKRAEEELQRTLESLRKAFGATIHVMVSTVEARDPYTAGHQLRSADLARAIATEMGLPQEKIDGLRMAGSIHDIGKLCVPAEILSKPTKLTDLEFSLIKVHPEQGYEMLKDVESPWPLAEIVYQHHERMDGSGYPRSLKGDEIMMEARIMAVADTVESMASHRPYRPAIGIEAALEEIERNSGTLYDNAVVDACLRLFREKGFKLVRE
jgi:PAS domain S-box-containing protein